MMAVVAAKENRQHEQEQYCDEAAAPPAIFPKYLLLEMLYAADQSVVSILRLARAAGFFGHVIVPPGIGLKIRLGEAGRDVADSSQRLPSTAGCRKLDP
jgi:hypothetical protein